MVETDADFLGLVRGDGKASKQLNRSTPILQLT